MNGIESVRTNCHDENRFEKKTAANGLFYFVLTTTNGQTIGKSQMYKSESGRNNGIDSVCRNAPDAKLEADASVLSKGPAAVAPFSSEFGFPGSLLRHDNRDA